MKIIFRISKKLALKLTKKLLKFPYIIFFWYCFFVSIVYSQPHYQPLQVNQLGSDALKHLLSRDYKSLLPPKSDVNYTPLYKATDFELKKLVLGGYLMAGDSISDYLNKVADKLITTRPSLKGTYRIFVYKTTTPNAFTFADGTILVTTGLMARLSSESELAFILAHELTHYIKKHSEQSFKRADKLGKDFDLAQAGRSNSFKILMDYSQENEMEADAMGLELMTNAGYHCHSSIPALKKVSLPDSAFKPTLINLRKHFQSEDFNMDSVNKDKNQVTYTESNSTSDNEDELSTHPDLDKRLIALKELIAQLGTTQVKDNNDSLLYSTIRYKAQMENIIVSFNAGNHDESLYLSLQGLNNFPEDNFIILMVAKNLVWLANYNDNDALDKALKENKVIYGGSFGELEKFLSSLSKPDLKRLSYSFIKSHYRPESKDEDLAFYMGYISEFYLGPGISRIYYNKYMKEFPGGRYTSFVENKLK